MPVTKKKIGGIPEKILGVSLGVKLSEREAAHSLPSSAEVGNTWNCASTPPMRIYGVVLS
jgi:hypothetical protein